MEFIGAERNIGFGRLGQSLKLSATYCFVLSDLGLEHRVRGLGFKISA